MWLKATYLRSASVAAISTLPVILGYALLGAPEARAATCMQDIFTCVLVQQSGANVVMTGSGEFDTTGLQTVSGGQPPVSAIPSRGRTLRPAVGLWPSVRVPPFNRPNVRLVGKKSARV